MPLPHYHACRIREPKDFEEGGFRTTTRKHDGKKYDVIIGKLNKADTMREQAYRYPTDVWTEKSAKKH